MVSTRHGDGPYVGQLNLMTDSLVDFPYKEASVNMWTWSRRGSGPFI